MTVTQTPSLPVLLVDDEALTLKVVVSTLRTGGITNTITCDDSRDVMRLLSENEVSVVLLDLIMPHFSGETLLPQMVQQFPDLPVLVVTGASDVDTAVRCMRLGAFDYLVKPVEPERLISSVRRAVELRELRADYGSLKQRLFSHELECPEAFSAILTQSPKMKSIFAFVETVACTSKPVLITGPTGVGKELLARATHAVSRRTGSFVAVNVAGVDDNVFSDTLFGHVRGAFTGADTVRPGLLERAAGGTLFLDEIGDLSRASQIKLLRLLQEREYFPVGADVPKSTDARVILATNHDLGRLVTCGEFRADLYYRLQVHQVVVPPLCDRMEDLPLLLEHFLRESAASLRKSKPTIPRELVTLLATYSFPGNIRELEAMVYRAVSQHDSGRLSMEPFRQEMRKERGNKHEPASVPSAAAAQPPVSIPQGAFPTLKEAAEYLVNEAIRRANGNQSVAAELLGITPSALNKRIHRAADRAEE